MITITTPNKTIQLDPATHRLTIQTAASGAEAPPSSISLPYESALRATPKLTPYGNPLARDLLLIGQAVLCADRAIKRGAHLGQQSRSIQVSVAVETLDTWQRVRKQVEALIEFVSRDRWQITFTQAPKAAHKPAPVFAEFPPDRVCLFSDGLDSLAGAVMALQTGRHPIFVSHTMPGFGTVKQTITKLQQQVHPNQKLPVRVVNLHFAMPQTTSDKSDKLFRESSRRTRPFFYLCLAGSVAVEFNVPVIQLNENGVLAANLPFSAANQHIGITRHAHPHVLRSFEQLLNALTDSAAFSVVNPSASLTKADEMEVLLDFSALAAATRSCENGGQQMARARAEHTEFKPRECGICVPCLIRRHSLATVGIKEEAGHYLHSDQKVYAELAGPANLPFSGSQPLLTLRNSAQKAADTLLKNQQFGVWDMVHFCQTIKNLSPAAFTIRYLPELSLLAPPEVDYRSYVADLYSMYQRFADQYLNYLLPTTTSTV